MVRSLNTVYTAVGICHAIYVDCLLARSGPDLASSQQNCMTNTHCCIYSVETSDDGE